MTSNYDRIQYYRFTAKQKTETIRRLAKALEGERRIKLVIVFGSLTRRNSVRDIDLCILAEPALDFKELLNLNAQIELELGMSIDLVQLTSLPPSLRTEILKNGTVIKGQKDLIKRLQNDHKPRLPA